MNDDPKKGKIPMGVGAAVAGLSLHDEDKVAPEQLIKIPMTKDEVESWIMLKGQTGKRWFKIVIVDEEVGQDPTMVALMETVSDMIFAGIQNIPFADMSKAASPKIEIVKG
jgi:hypothetical protein